MTIKIYVEGGGDSDALRTACRRGFSEFLRRAGLGGRMPRIVACGTRNNAFERFCTALRSPSRGEFPLLLVDSEAVIASGVGPWCHLAGQDAWEQPVGASDEHVHLMIQCMETWFLADQDALAVYFGPDFNRNSLPRQTDLEDIAKEEVLRKLGDASRYVTKKGQYNKGRHSFAILEQINPTLVRQKCPSAERFIVFLLNH